MARGQAPRIRPGFRPFSVEDRAGQRVSARFEHAAFEEPATQLGALDKRGRPTQGETRVSARATWAGSQRTAAWAAALALTYAAVGCGTGGASIDYGRWDATDRMTAGSGLLVAWTKPLAPEFGGPYLPVERAGAAVDPIHGRMYVGSTQRVLWAFSAQGRPIYRFRTESSIDAKPTLDIPRNELYVATSSGRIHALRASDGHERFTAEVGAAISQPGVLSEDALYVVTDADGVYALSRADGSILWRYQREPRAGLKVTGHAGLLDSEQRLITGFSDGTIVALDKSDGRVLWSVDTTLDFADPSVTEQGFVDVDTTPVQVGDLVYAASFMAGLYALQVKDGATHYRNPELTGVTSLSGDDRTLVLVSAERGVECFDLPTWVPRWRRTDGFRGAPNNVQVLGRAAYVTVSRGALLALAMSDGHEIGRVQTEHGFATGPSLVDGQGAILGNAGVLYAFRY